MSEKSSKAAAKFLWIPGQGSDDAAINRMKKYFPRPPQPMGEAWFMSEERRMFNELYEDLHQLNINSLIEPLEEIGSGTSCFGPVQEWHDWFHYLLAQTLHTAHTRYAFRYYIEYIMTAFMNIYPQGIESEPYKGFREDALNTLGQSIMDEECWEGQNIVMEKILNSSNRNPAKRWGWDEAAGDFSSSMFFCLKYLKPEQISAWASSVLSIKSPHWRAQVIVWLVGADKILKGKIQQPCQFKGHPSIKWNWSLCIDGCIDHLEREKKQFPDFIAVANRNAFLETVRRTINEDIYLDWLSSISLYDYIEAEMFGIPGLFEEIYFPKA